VKANVSKVATADLKTSKKDFQMLKVFLIY
ncbi:MAG: hypothetical protein ACI9VT_004174, partial [Psychroserpens sp.]